jgi:hypothetical protein
MHRDRVAALPFDDDRPPEECPDRRGLHIQPAAEEREARELGLQVRGPPVELRATIDEEADDAALDRDGIGSTQMQRRQAGRRDGRAQGIEGLRS